MKTPEGQSVIEGNRPDMSPEAIGRRLRIVSDLRALCLKLGRAKKVKREGRIPKRL